MPMPLRDAHHGERGQEGRDADARSSAAVDGADDDAGAEARTTPPGRPKGVHRDRGRHARQPATMPIERSISPAAETKVMRRT